MNDNNHVSPKPAGHPLPMDRVQDMVAEITNNNMQLVQQNSNKIGYVSLRRAMNFGYLMACQDHGIPVPEMPDPLDDFPGLG
jgi:hypothetical protein